MTDYVDAVADSGNPIGFGSTAPVGPTIVLLADSSTGSAFFQGVMTFAAIGGGGGSRHSNHKFVSFF